MKDDMIEKMYAFAKKASEHMYAAAVKINEVEMVTLVIESDKMGITAVERFLTAAPINVITLLNEVKRYRDALKKALDESKRLDKEAGKTEDSDLTVMLEAAYEDRNTEIIVQRDIDLNKSVGGPN